MADWTNITDTAVDPDAPLTSQLGYAWRDNPIAIAEGAVGAPRVMHNALNTYIGSMTTTGSTPIEFLNTNGSLRFLSFGSVSPGGGYDDLQVSYSTNGGSSWGGWITILSGYSVSVSQFEINGFLDCKLGKWFGIPNDPTFTGSTAANAIRFRMSNDGGGPSSLDLTLIGMGV